VFTKSGNIYYEQIKKIQFKESPGETMESRLNEYKVSMEIAPYTSPKSSAPIPAGYTPKGSFPKNEMVYKNYVISFQKVIDVPGKPVGDIYKSALKWISVSYKNPESVITSTIENDIITGRGSGIVVVPAVIFSHVPHYRYNFRIDVKDNKARITLSEFELVGTPPEPTGTLEYLLYKNGTPKTSRQALAIKEGISDDVDRTIFSLEQHLIGKTEKKDDW
jgi:hypothetical protein